MNESWSKTKSTINNMRWFGFIAIYCQLNRTDSEYHLHAIINKITSFKLIFKRFERDFSMATSVAFVSFLPHSIALSIKRRLLSYILRLHLHGNLISINIKWADIPCISIFSNMLGIGRYSIH